MHMKRLHEPVDNTRQTISDEDNMTTNTKLIYPDKGDAHDDNKTDHSEDNWYRLFALAKGSRRQLSMFRTGITRAVNDSCSLKYLFWGYFPTGKHKIAFKIIEEINTVI